MEIERKKDGKWRSARVPAGKVRVLAVARHRNGICGNGFHVVRFDWMDDGETPRRMVATLFDEAGSCAVLDADEAARGNVAMGAGNSWRGDHFEDALRKAIAEAEKEV